MDFGLGGQSLLRKSVADDVDVPGLDFVPDA
jgi:hypothetical protein